LAEALGEGRHAKGGLQWVLRRHQPPHFVKIEGTQRQAADVQVAAMRRVERAAEQPDAPPSRNQGRT
jgi:hypothetical protein